MTTFTLSYSPNGSYTVAARPVPVSFDPFACARCLVIRRRNVPATAEVAESDQPTWLACTGCANDRVNEPTDPLSVRSLQDSVAAFRSTVW